MQTSPGLREMPQNRSRKYDTFKNSFMFAKRQCYTLQKGSIIFAKIVVYLRRQYVVFAKIVLHLQRYHDNCKDSIIFAAIVLYLRKQYYICRQSIIFCNIVIFSFSGVIEMIHVDECESPKRLVSCKLTTSGSTTLLKMMISMKLYINIQRSSFLKQCWLFMKTNHEIQC